MAIEFFYIVDIVIRCTNLGAIFVSVSSWLLELLNNVLRFGDNFSII